MNDICAPIVRKAVAIVKRQFRLDFNDGVHGIAHWSRVWLHGRRLASELDVNPMVLAWFAFLHDSQRHNDHLDPLHGSRAADFAVQLRGEGLVDELDGREFEWLCEAMRLHSDGRNAGEVAILACWDADRLDLGRVGIEPRPDRLCTAAARAPHVIAEAMRLTQQARDALPPFRIA